MQPDPSVELRHRPLLFVSNLETPELAEFDHHHFAKVRRVANGSPITISDGAGSWRLARFANRPEIGGPVQFVAQSSPVISVGFTPVKHDRPEWVVQKLTELGVDVIVPLLTDRSVVKWSSDRAERQEAKWQVAAREAAMQSRRVRLPRIEPLQPLVNLANRSATVLADPAGQPVGQSDLTILVGPEGGWSESELIRWPVRSLPGGILRAGTAAIVAATQLLIHRASCGKQAD